MMGQPVLLLLHGAAASKAQFNELVPLLKPHFAVHTLDFEGHGGLPGRDRPFSIEYFAENVVNYLDSHHLAQSHCFGYSMGGYVALYLAFAQPERVGQVFTLATKFDWTPEIAAREVGFLDADKILAKVPQFAAQLQQQHRATDWKLVLQRTREMLTDLGTNNLLNATVLAQIHHHVRIGVGDRDAMVSIEESLDAYRALKNAEFQVFANTPHPFDRVAPHLIADALTQFLQP